MTKYRPDFVSIIAGVQKVLSREDVYFIGCSIKRLREGKGNDDFAIIDPILHNFPYLLKRFGVSEADRKIWKIRHWVRGAKQALRRWKKNRDELGVYMLETFLDEHLPLEELKVTRRELQAIVKEMQSVSVKKTLEGLRAGAVSVGVSVFFEELEDSGLTLADVGSDESEMKAFALREALEYVRLIRAEDDFSFPFGGILGLLETKLVTWSDFGMTEKEFDSRHSEQNADESTPGSAKIRDFTH
ncbi:MAG: hypothetical protein WCJ29_02505 [bacterium]